MLRSWWLIALVGCYRPAALDDCLVVCGADTGQVCPPGQSCVEGICKSDDRTGPCPLLDDAQQPLDAFEFQDAGPDGMLPATAVCWGAAGDFFHVCMDVEPTGALSIAGGATVTIDTNDCPQNQPQSNPPAVCILGFSSVSIANTGTLRVKGNRPLAIVSVGAIVVSGTIDVSSRPGDPGANANVYDCNVAAAGSLAAGAGGGGGGGAGGSLTAGGGQGGAGTGGSAGGGVTQPIDAAKLMRIRGGCPGAAGGKASVGNGGTGGAGGGAIYLMSKASIQLFGTAVINASGAGGSPPGKRAGGGGGGSGGFIGFHADMGYSFQAAAKVFAVGGAGASGGATSNGNPGMEAVGPMMTTPTSGPIGAGVGGFGSPIKGGNGTNASDGGGGGGGGGGGIIIFHGQLPAAGQFAPTPIAP